MASLAEEVTAELDRLGIPFCVIGAIALAAQGVPRGTMDLDLLVLEPKVLDRATWARLVEHVGVDVRRGDAEDPLLGVVRFTSEGETEVDVIVGRGGWQHKVIDRAVAVQVGSRTLPVAAAADLVLLKLFAGGPQDAWDIEQLLSAAAADTVAVVDARVQELPADARELWARLRPAGQTS